MIKLKILLYCNFYESSFKIAWFFTFSAKTSDCGLALNEPQTGVTNDHFHSVFVGIVSGVAWWQYMCTQSYSGYACVLKLKIFDHFAWKTPLYSSFYRDDVYSSAFLRMARYATAYSDLCATICFALQILLDNTNVLIKHLFLIGITVGRTAKPLVWIKHIYVVKSSPVMWRDVLWPKRERIVYIQF